MNDLPSSSPGQAVTVRPFTDADSGAWDRYVAECPGASCYHLSCWKKVIEQTFGHRAYYLLAEDNKRNIVGILPLVHMKSLLFGNFMVSLPYFNYGGICTEGDENRYLLFRRAVELCRSRGAGHLELRQSAPIAGLPVKTNKVSMRLAMPGTADELWASFPAKLRSQVKRPQKEGMSTTVGREEELEAFYSVFAATMRDLGTPVYSQRFFENILAEHQASWICTVRTAQGEPVAAGFLVGFKDALEIPWASSLKQFNSLSPNMLLYHRALSFACEEGYLMFDFGRSTAGGGTFRFKQQWGALPAQLYWHYWMRNGTTMPEMNPDNPRYRAAISLWKKLPVNVTRLIGPAIVKNIP